MLGLTFSRVKSWLQIIRGAALNKAGNNVPTGPELTAGDMAPAFAAPGSDGNTHTLAESRGKQAVVLAWFPKTFTGG